MIAKLILILLAFILANMTILIVTEDLNNCEIDAGLQIKEEEEARSSKSRIETTLFLLKNQLPFTLAPRIMEHILSAYGSVNVLASPYYSRANCISKTYKEVLSQASLDESAEKNGPSYLCSHHHRIKESSTGVRWMSGPNSEKLLLELSLMADRICFQKKTSQ